MWKLEETWSLNWMEKREPAFRDQDARTRAQIEEFHFRLTANFTSKFETTANAADSPPCLVEPRCYFASSSSRLSITQLPADSYKNIFAH